MRTVYKHDLTGQRFGKLIALHDTPERKHGKVVWLCKCDCGNECKVMSTRLVSGHTQSCGCYSRERTIAFNTTHNMTGTRLYRIWSSMKTRCTNPNVKCHKYYVDKGVTICEEWRNDFASFYDWAMAHGYRDDLTIDRIDGDEGYSPDNCRWATWHEQRMNQKRG